MLSRVFALHLTGAAGTSASLYFVATMFQSPSDASLSVIQTHFDFHSPVNRVNNDLNSSKAQSPCAPSSSLSEGRSFENEGGRCGKKRVDQ
jgi:hypothetical protein